MGNGGGIGWGGDEMDPARRAETLYGLAVAACRLGRIAEARLLLGRALEIGGEAMKLRAPEDRALDGVWGAD